MKPPSVLQAFLITLSGTVLAFLGCVGALTADNTATGIGNIALTAFFIGLAIFLIGGFVLAVSVVRAIWDSLTRKRRNDAARGA